MDSCLAKQWQIMITWLWLMQTFNDFTKNIRRACLDLDARGRWYQQAKDFWSLHTLQDMCVLLEIKPFKNPLFSQRFAGNMFNFKAVTFPNQRCNRGAVCGQRFEDVYRRVFRLEPLEGDHWQLTQVGPPFLGEIYGDIPYLKRWYQKAVVPGTTFKVGQGEDQKPHGAVPSVKTTQAASANGDTQSYAAGFLEGALTHTRNGVSVGLGAHTRTGSKF